MDGMTEPVYATQEEADAAAKAKQDAAETERKRALVKLARERFNMAEEAESELRKLADEDIRFRAGEQWDKSVLAQRQVDGRPALVINRIPQFERQVTNEQRQSKPAINVSPVDDGGDRETAEVLQGVIRNIEYNSGADVAYDTALTCAVRGGFGYFRIVTEFEHEGSFEQRLAIKRVRDPFSIYLDPSHQEQDASDADWGFVVDDGVAQEEFKRAYPNCEPVAGGWGDRANDKGRTCQVVEYFYREREPDHLLMLSQAAQPTAPHPETGEMVPSGDPVPVGEPVTVFQSDADADPERFAGMLVVGSRPTHRIRVKWAKIAGSEVVEETEFPSRYIPIVPVLGDEIFVGGKRILEGIVRNAKDPQRQYNYWCTAITETIALAPKAPYIVAEGQIAGREKEWAQAASRNLPYLQYRQVDVAGKPAPPPQRNAFEAPVAAMTQALQIAAEDMKASTGVYDAALGNRSNENSGRAILARQNQSQTATLHFSDNLARAMRHMGRILIDAIPRVYSNARILRVLGEDQSEKMVGVNGAQTEKQERHFDLNTGRYDVTVSMGPSYTSKRQEMVATLLEFFRVNPNAAAVSGDLLADSMDFAGAKKLAERLKKTLPPGVAEPDPDAKPDPGVLMHQLQGALQQNEQLTQAIHAAHDTIDQKVLELQSAERKDLIARQANLAAAYAATDPTDAAGRAFLFSEIQRLEARLDTFFPPAPPNGAPQS